MAVDGVARGYACVPDGPTLWISRDGLTWTVREQERLEAERHRAGGAAGGQVLSPMPGTVVLVEVTEGQQVTAGQKLLVVEAMKMEHVLVAPVDGTVSALKISAGGTVAKDAVLLVVQP